MPSPDAPVGPWDIVRVHATITVGGVWWDAFFGPMDAVLAKYLLTELSHGPFPQPIKAKLEPVGEEKDKHG